MIKITRLIEDEKDYWDGNDWTSDPTWIEFTSWEDLKEILCDGHVETKMTYWVSFK